MTEERKKIQEEQERRLEESDRKIELERKIRNAAVAKQKKLLAGKSSESPDSPGPDTETGPDTDTETDPDSEDESHELGRPYMSDDYQNLYNLVTHSDKSSEADHLAFATSASLMLFYLKINNYFGSNASRESDRELNESESLIGRLLYHLLEVVLYNGQDICQAAAWSVENGLTVSSIGTSVNTTLAMFNHSCAPNTTRANIGASTVLVATEDIRKGQEVMNYYTIQYHDKILTTRQPFLRDHYKFECR